MEPSPQAQGGRMPKREAEEPSLKVQASSIKGFLTEGFLSCFSAPSAFPQTPLGHILWAFVC